MDFYYRQIKAKAYERSDERTNSRNGYRVRQLTTRVGTLELHVPKLRHGNFSTQLFKRYQRSDQPYHVVRHSHWGDAYPSSVTVEH